MKKATRDIVLSLINTEGVPKSKRLDFAMAMIAIQAIDWQLSILEMAEKKEIELVPPVNVQKSSLISKKKELVKLWGSNAPF